MLYESLAVDRVFSTKDLRNLEQTFYIINPICSHMYPEKKLKFVFSGSRFQL